MFNNTNNTNNSPYPLVADDVVKGTEIWVRFDMKNAKDNSPAPSEVFLGWVTRITAAGVVWIRFGRCNGRSTYTFDLHEMLENKGDFMRAGPPVVGEKEQRENKDDDCAEALDMLFCVEI